MICQTGVLFWGHPVIVHETLDNLEADCEPYYITD